MTLVEFNELSIRYREAQNWLDYRTALICAVMANTARDPKRKVLPYTPEDFMPKKDRRQMTDQQMYIQVEAINTILGGKVIEV